MARKYARIWLAVLVLAVGLAALACNFGSDQGVDGEPVETPQGDIEAGSSQPTDGSTTTVEGHALSLPAVMFGFSSGEESVGLAADSMLAVPSGWFYAGVEQEELTGMLFSKQSPQELAAFDDPVLAVPMDFAGGAFVKTELPAGADPQAMLAGMETSLEELGDQDLGAMLIAADQAGLLNLKTIDSTRLDKVWMGEMGGKPAIMMEGTAYFLDGKQPVLRMQVRLAWTQEAFYSLYLLASETAWQETSAAFEAVGQSITLP